ncbi:MAG: hypothetical protein ACTSSE_00465 [Candidatus Thorarchaeota archaeon]
MSGSSDYYDFVHRLCDFVIENDSPVMVAYFAIHHSMISLDFKLIDKIREKYGHHKILGPNLFFASAHQGTYEDVKKVHEMADEIIDSEPDDWIALEMYFMKFEADMRNYPTTIYQTSTMEKIRELIDSDPKFGFYEIVLNDHLAIRAYTDGDTEERIRCLNRGIEIAEKFDDRLRFAHLLIRKGNVLIHQNRITSRECLEKAYQIVDSSLVIPGYYADIVYTLSILDAIQGEFDKGIKGLLESVTIRERAGLNSANASYYLSILYNIIDEPESGLEWGQMAEDQFKSRPYLINRAVLIQAWSLVILEKLTEAQALIDTVRDSVLKSGDENQLAWLHIATGHLELFQGNYSQAMSSIEQALRIFEQQGSTAVMEFYCLYQLAKIEILSSDVSEIVSPSLAILEERALAENLIGINGQVLVLKAEIANLNNDDALLLEIIPQLRQLTEKASLQFLKPHFERLLKGL